MDKYLNNQKHDIDWIIAINGSVIRIYCESEESMNELFDKINSKWTGGDMQHICEANHR